MLTVDDAIAVPGPARLPPPPVIHRPRFARGSIAPPYMDVREIAPPDAWSRIDRVQLPTRIDRLAASLVGALTMSIAALAVLLIVLR